MTTEANTTEQQTRWKKIIKDWESSNQSPRSDFAIVWIVFKSTQWTGATRHCCGQCWRGLSIDQLFIMAPFFRPANDMPNINLYREPVDFRKNFGDSVLLLNKSWGIIPSMVVYMPLPTSSVIKTNACTGKITVLYCITKAWLKEDLSGHA